jgi:hypothetical protein
MKLPGRQNEPKRRNSAERTQMRLEAELSLVARLMGPRRPVAIGRQQLQASSPKALPTTIATTRNMVGLG